MATHEMRETRTNKATYGFHVDDGTGLGSTGSSQCQLMTGGTVALTVDSSQVVNVPADKFTVGGVIVPQLMELSFLLTPAATVTEKDLWICPVGLAYKVVKISIVPSTLQGGALTATIVKATGTATPVKTTTPMHTADSINLNSGAYTVVNVTLTSTVADLALVAGDRISIDYSGAYTVGHAVVAVTLQRV